MAKFTRDEFREYLEECGAMKVLTETLTKLYDQEVRPENPIRFIRENLFTPQEIEEIEARDPVISLRKGFVKLLADKKCLMLLKKHLTKELYERLKPLSTTMGATLYDCIRSGLENHDSCVGVYAADPQSYSTFADLFDPIIEEYHQGFKKDDLHPEFDLGDPSAFKNLDPKKQYVVSTRVRTTRSIVEFPFGPRLTEDQYREILNTVKTALEAVEGEFAGKLHALDGMDKDLQKQLDDILFKEGDKFLQSAQACRFWPVGRAIFFTENKDFLVWVNEKEHLKFISMEPSGDLGKVYKRFVNGLNVFVPKFKFARDDRLGWLTFRPTNLGTAIRASVHIKLPKLSADMEKFEEIVGKHNLKIRSSASVPKEAGDRIFDISNKRRLGLTEFEAVSDMYNGITEIIKIEKSLK